MLHKQPIIIGDPSQLWKAIGQALWQLQALEFALGHYLVLTNVVPGQKEEAYRQLDKAFEATLGRLVNKIKESVHVHPEIEGRLKHLTDERNWLAHRIFRLHHTDIYEIQCFTQLLARTNKLGDEALNIAKEIAELCKQWCIANGLKAQDINAEIMTRLQERWKK